ncbi:MAG: HEAT repeat domain-containing protein, partial [archaeon]|nr:HEAT repeat domain-containing protein [archaeon]
QNEAILEQLLLVLRSENAVAGEAAGIAIGLVMLGSANQTALTAMIQHAHLTDHEKIIRGVAIGSALIMYGQEEAADTLIEQLVGDKDPILRYGGMFAIGMAYCGTANNDAIRRLLHTAVSDVSDDVRRAAVLCLGFLLFRQPELCPKLVSLLAGSYNPHVRYGATMAVGISCAGTALKPALDLLEPMTRDDKDFVRQGAFIAISMVLLQTSAADEPAVTKFRALFQERIAYKHEPLMAKFGAILASGIIDAGGRNVTIALQSQSGHLNLPGIIGVCLFTQYWYWYPLIHFLSLAFQPTAVIGLTGDLKIPEWSFVSNAPPSKYAYPEPYKAPTAAAPTSIKTAVLSTSKKAQQRAAQKAVDGKKDGPEEKPLSDDAPALSSPAPAAAPEPEPEANFEVLQNPARVTPRQLNVISFSTENRWVPVDSNRSKTGGIIILVDSNPGQPVLESALAHAEPTTAPIPSAPTTVETDEVEPPESFELQDDDFN